jgi:Rrf2 family protein
MDAATALMAWLEEMTQLTSGSPLAYCVESGLTYSTKSRNQHVKFSKKSEYALRALIQLSSSHRRSLVRREEIGKRQRIPVQFLGQILLPLKRAGLVASRRGTRGGYSLMKPPDEITLGQVIRILDGPLAPIACVSKTAYQKCLDCPYAAKRYCPMQHVMGTVRDAIADILDNYTLSDFASGHRTRSQS